jgi:hypothetical protein
MKFYRLLPLIVILFFNQFAIGQNTEVSVVKQRKYIKYLDVRFENGAMLSNSTDIGDQLIESSYYNGVDFRLGFRRTDTNNVYSTVYRRPYIGLGLYSSTFHNAAVGEPNAIYFFITIPFTFERAKKFTFSYSAAFGLSYNLNPYNPIENPTNVFVGSARNCYVHLGVLANYKISDRFALNGTLGFKHFSNGSFQLPNAGINLIPLTIGASYKLNKENVNFEETNKSDFIKHHVINFVVAAGSKNYDVGGDNHLKMTFSVDYLRHFNYKYKAGLGLDVFYSTDANLRNDSDKSDFSKSISYALVGAWEWSLTDHLYAPIGIAFYLHRNEENGEITSYYERAGLAYRFNNNMFVGVTIKAHGGVADYFEWKVGYTIQHDPNTYR